MKLVPPLPSSEDELDPYEEYEADITPSDQEIYDTQPRTNDLSNAMACAQAFGLNYRYVPEWQAWLAWVGTHWVRVGAELKLFAAVAKHAQLEYYLCSGRLKKLTVQRVTTATKFGLGSPELQELEAKITAETVQLKWHCASQNTPKVNACMTQLRDVCAQSFVDFDRNPWLLNCPNGTVDLQTGDLLDHDRANLITSCLAVRYHPDEKAPRWERFLRECMAGNSVLALYLQRLVGYTLTATTDEHLLMFCYGSGANGKSTFLRVLQELLGPYGCALPRTLLFTTRPGEVHPTELATLHGKRLGVCSEVGEDARLDEAKLKDLTGGDPISCRRMKEDFWTFTPTHTLWLGGNHRPIITGTDNGIWRRMHVVPWTVTFDQASQEKDLPARLHGELVGILAWAVAGCLEWQRIGIADPPEVLAATSEYRGSSDILGEFFRLHVVFDPEGRTTCRALRLAYETWCTELGHTAIGARRLGQRLRSLGVTPTTRRVDGKVVDAWSGVRLPQEYERLAP